MSQFELQPYLTGELVSLRPLSAVDFEPLFEIARDPLMWVQHPQTNRFQKHIFEEFFDAAVSSGGALTVVDRAKNEIIGSTRYCNFEPHLSQIEVGYTFLARRCWGRLFNQDMKKIVINHALQYVENVLFHVGEHNFRSRRALEKIGAEHFSQSIVEEGARGRECIYRVTAESVQKPNNDFRN